MAGKHRFVGGSLDLTPDICDECGLRFDSAVHEVGLSDMIHQAVMILSDGNNSERLNPRFLSERIGRAMKILGDVHSLVADQEQSLSRTLCEHWPTLTCHHEEHKDSVACSCAGWGSGKKDTVGYAIQAWAGHVVEELGRVRKGGYWTKRSPSPELVAHARELVETLQRDGVYVGVAAKYLEEYERRKCCGPNKEKQ